MWLKCTWRCSFSLFWIHCSLKSASFQFQFAPGIQTNQLLAPGESDDKMNWRPTCFTSHELVKTHTSCVFVSLLHVWGHSWVINNMIPSNFYQVIWGWSSSFMRDNQRPSWNTMFSAWPGVGSEWSWLLKTKVHGIQSHISAQIYLKENILVPQRYDIYENGMDVSTQCEVMLAFTQN